ncbi:arylsulfatase [Prescottella sp. R16]|uniref:arylsulfatase n=1 Tax=Prescottella sp. R16 TaxID=3064529 RepID=UPI00272E34CA|nr:arylsulfatase [Prescottella sp. R16]
MNTFRSYPESQPHPGPIGRTTADSEPAWPVAAKAPAHAKNVIVVLLDDVGFAQFGCFGGLGGRLETPNIDRLAGSGTRFNNFHTTPLCSPTRAALMTGRNAHSVGVGVIMEYSTGYPGYHSRIPKSAAMLPAVLKENGYSTMALGKWHLTPDWESGPWGPFDRWPLGQGFERYYGFLPGETSQWAPELVEDNRYLEGRPLDKENYHLSEDLVDHAIEWIASQKTISPTKPFFTYLAFGAAHAPHHAPAEWIEKYRGCFDEGWDVVRKETLARQIELGVVPTGTPLPEHNPGVRNWDDIDAAEQQLLVRQMEVFAGFLGHTDHQIGRLVTYLEEHGLLDDTVILVHTDNGASAEGGMHGMFNEMSFFNRVPETVEDMRERMDEWGSPTSHPHYATGWAEVGNTPQRWYKVNTHEGGTRVPMVMHWPGRAEPGSVASPYVHVVDVVPTLLEGLGIEMPAVVNGYEQMPLEGHSFLGAIDDPSLGSTNRSQHFECFGHRAVYRDGWKAVTTHWTTAQAFRVGTHDRPTHDGDWNADEWELYHLDEDFNEVDNLADTHPELLGELVDEWWSLAEKHNVLPLDDTGSPRSLQPRPSGSEQSPVYTYDTPIILTRSTSPAMFRQPFVLTADVTTGVDTRGVIFSFGNANGGVSLFLDEGRVSFVSNFLGREHYHGSAQEPLPAGRHTILVDFKQSDDGSASAACSVDGTTEFEIRIDRTNPILWAVAQGLEVGTDTVSPVWPGYVSPARFTGRVHLVTVQLPAGEDAPDLEAEDRVARVRQ